MIRRSSVRRIGIILYLAVVVFCGLTGRISEGVWDLFFFCAVLFAFIAAFFAGIIQATLNNPLYVKEYGQWLKTTPWKVGDPSPLGSIGIPWVEVGIFLAVDVMLYFGQLAVEVPPATIIFLATYIGVYSLMMLSWTTPWMWIGLFVVFALEPHSWLVLVLIPALLLIVRDESQKMMDRLLFEKARE